MRYRLDVHSRGRAVFGVRYLGTMWSTVTYEYSCTGATACNVAAFQKGVSMIPTPLSPPPPTPSPCERASQRLSVTQVGRKQPSHSRIPLKKRKYAPRLDRGSERTKRTVACGASSSLRDSNSLRSRALDVVRAGTPGIHTSTHVCWFASLPIAHRPSLPSIFPPSTGHGGVAPASPSTAIRSAWFAQDASALMIARCVCVAALTVFARRGDSLCRVFFM